MLHKQFELKNVANIVETAASISKMSQIPQLLPMLWKMSGFNSKMLQRQLKWQLPAPKCRNWQGKRAEKTDAKRKFETEKK